MQYNNFIGYLMPNAGLINLVPSSHAEMQLMQGSPMSINGGNATQHSITRIFLYPSTHTTTESGLPARSN